MSTWIIGSLAARHVAELAIEFKQKGACDGTYRPYMANPESLGMKSSDRAFSSGHVAIYTHPDDLQSLDLQLTASKLPVLALPHEANELRIFCDIYEHFPQWQELCHDACSAFGNMNSWLSSMWQSLVCEIIPIASAKHLRSLCSVTSHHLLGTIFTAMPPQLPISPKESLQITFAHELGHQVLCLYQRCDDIVTKSAPIYSGTRKTQRPAIMAIHAAVALRFMIEAIKHLLQKNPHHEFLKDLWRQFSRELSLNLADIHRKAELTPLGRCIIQELARKDSHD